MKYVKEWTDKRTGKKYARFRRPGHPEVMLPTPVGGPDFMFAYRAALFGNPAPALEIGATLRSPVNSFNSALAKYLASSAWKKLKPKTQKTRGPVFESLRTQNGSAPLAHFNRQAISKYLAEIKAPHARIHHLKAIRKLMEFSADTGLLEEDPSVGLARKFAPPKTDGHRTWTQQEIEQFELYWPIGSMPRMAIALAKFCGQRRGDLWQIGREHIKSGCIVLKQAKGGENGSEVQVPVHPELAKVIAATPAALHGKFLYHDGGPNRGKQFTDDQLGHWFRRRREEAGLPKGLSLHGLRKSFCTTMAESGATTFEIMGNSGHRSLASVEPYIRKVDRAKAAAAGMAKMIAHGTKP